MSHADIICCAFTEICRGAYYSYTTRQSSELTELLKVSTYVLVMRASGWWSDLGLDVTILNDYASTSNTV
jgi:hypothetical protein